MKNTLLFLLFVLGALSAQSQITYEDFEGGAADLPWQALDGAYNGPVDNPAPNVVNSSAKCGEYIKAGTTGYSLLLVDNGATAFDMTTQNQFKIDIYTSAATQVLLKLEDPGGPSIEATKNIGVTNAWQTYTFDFSAAAAQTNLTKVVLFFDPGVVTSTDTYYFDNLAAVPQGACAGVALSPDVIDDFECNRNATYVNGWDSLSVVNNPAPGGANTSSKVGKYIDPLGESYAALLIDYENPIDLSTKNLLRLKVRSPKVGTLLLKLEGGASPAKEIPVQITQINQWVQYEADFSDQALASHKKIVMFFNAGVDGVPGDVYYVDDIERTEVPIVALEDFENGASLPWMPKTGGNPSVIHGAFSVVDNPAPGGVNDSPKVGKYTKGTSGFSTLVAVAPGVIDISVKPQFNLDVWAPVGSVKVQMELVSPVAGIKDISVNLTNPGNWETLAFDFTEFQSITDWEGMNLIFNLPVVQAGAMFFFDNLIQSGSTVDPCEGILPIANILDDFECQRNYAYGAGADRLTVVPNPDVAQLNQSTTVGKYKEVANEPWSPICMEIPDGIDLSVFNQLGLLVEAPAAVPILFKLEGGSSPAAEIFVDYTTPGEWERVTADFSGQVGMDHKRVCFFFNGGQSSPNEDDYFIDNISFNHAPFDGCMVNYEEPAFSSLEWKYFPNDTDGGFEVVDNPAPGGINTSNKVGKATENADSGQPWQGMYTDLPAPIKFGANKLVKMKIHSPQVASVTMKLENPLNPNAPGTSGDNTVANTVANAWEELTWDFNASPNPLPDDGDYQRITLIWDINNLPTSDVIYFFDDIRLDGGNCIATGVLESPKLLVLSIAPNPVNQTLRVDNLQEISRLEIYNLLGRRVANVWTGYENRAELDLSQFPAGMYTLAGFDRQGVLTSNAKFVKQ